MSHQVVVEPHNPRWTDMFTTEAKRIVQAIGPNFAAIHHIGSTAIPNIHAKPIIDILLEVARLDDLDACGPGMEALGYQAMGEFGIPGRRYFRKDDDRGIRTHQVHAFVASSHEVKRHLAFRDFMIDHPDWAQRYSNLKRALATAHSDMESYMDGKDSFIKQIDRMAAELSEGS